MSEKQTQKEISKAVDTFKAGALQYQLGVFMERHSTQRAGLRKCNLAAEKLDILENNSRASLISLLDEPNMEIRVIAAGHLVKTIPERALAVLKEIDECYHGDATMTAWHFLRQYRAGLFSM